MVEQIDEIDVALEIGVLLAELHHHPAQLQLLGLGHVGDEADQAERLPLRLGEGRRLVERGSWSSSHSALCGVVVAMSHSVFMNRGLRFHYLAVRDVRPDHLCRIDDAIEFRLGDEAELQRSGLEREVVVHRVVCDLRRLVVADDRRQRRDQHQRAVDVFLDLLKVGLRPLDQEPAEIRAAVGQDRDRMGDVEDDQRLVDVHFQIAAGTAEIPPRRRSPSPGRRSSSAPRPGWD